MSDAATATLDTLVTPALVLERGLLERNLGRMARVVRERGVQLRPHLKTAKSVDVARLAAPDSRGPVAVSTLKEAEYFLAAGYRDLFYAVGIGPGKIGRALALAQAGADLIVSVDTLEVARLVAAAAAARRVHLRVLIEVDCGEGRGGLPPESAELVAIAEALGPWFAGITTHAGQSYAARGDEAMLRVAEVEVATARAAGQRLAAAGYPCTIVSIGSSPTALTRNSLEGVTEVRAGVYMFGDLFQAGIGTCTVDDVAVTVLTEVIGRPASGALLVDAGAFALSKDVATASLAPALQAGFGWVADITGRRLPDLRVERVWQEHGLITSARPLAVGEFPVGTRLRILPNHICPTAAAHAGYHVVNGTRDIEAYWPRCNGW